MNFVFALLSIFLFFSVTQAAGTFNVRNYGAKGDGTTLDTEAIQKAFAAAEAAKGGTVTFPAGTYLTFPFRFQSSQTTLFLEPNAIVKANPNINNWPVSGTSYVPFISANDFTGISIAGKGKVDGSGSIWWVAFRNKQLKYDRPTLVHFEKCKDVLITDATFIDSPNHNLELYSDNTVVSGVTVTAPGDSPNTDAIDIHGTPFHVTNCNLSVGDDNIANHASNVLVENCFFGTGHGASIGSVSSGEISNVTFRNIVFKGTVAGPRIKTDPGATGYVRNVVYESLDLTGVKDQIVIDMYYESKDNTPTTLSISDITFQNIYSRGGVAAGQFICQPSSPCKNIQVLNVTIEGNVKPYDCQNVSGTTRNDTPVPCF